MEKTCLECGKKLNRNETALSQKILGKNIDKFYCIDCLAEYLDCSRDDLEIKIQEFKEHGCTSFL